MGDDGPGALLAALKFLARRDHFRAELERKLARRFDPEETRAAIERCAAMGYLDDETLARRFAELRGPMRGWGPARIEAELQARGVEDSVAQRASHLEPGIFEIALEVAARRAAARARAGWWATGEGRSRMISSLLRRGFSPEAAHRAVDRQRAAMEAADNADHDQSGDPDCVS